MAEILNIKSLTERPVENSDEILFNNEDTILNDRANETPVLCENNEEIFFRIEKFSKIDKVTISTDILNAKSLIEKLISILLPPNISFNTLSILSLCFNLDVYNERLDNELSLKFWERIGQIRDRLESMNTILRKVPFIYTPEQPKDMVDAYAYVYPDERNEAKSIQITKYYFEIPAFGDLNEFKVIRSARIIHELIHCYNSIYHIGPVDFFEGEDHSHPGMHKDTPDTKYYNEREFTQKTSIGIPFEKAIYNAYCYQYLTLWSMGNQ